MEDVGTLVELFGAAGCPYTQELREHLEWNGVTFIEHDIEADEVSRARLRTLTGAGSVPVLVENGRVTQVGWQGRSCVVGL